MIRKKSNKISKLGNILWELLSESGISQAVCSKNMGQYENYLTNYSLSDYFHLIDKYIFFQKLKNHRSQPI